MPLLSSGELCGFSPSLSILVSSLSSLFGFDFLKGCKASRGGCLLCSSLRNLSVTKGEFSEILLTYEGLDLFVCSTPPVLNDLVFLVAGSSPKEPLRLF
jgi:hypothetical protein